MIPDGQGQAAAAHHDRANGSKQDTSSSESVSVVHAVLGFKHMATHMCPVGAKSVYLQLNLEPSLDNSDHSFQMLDPKVKRCAD